MWPLACFAGCSLEKFPGEFNSEPKIAADVALSCAALRLAQALQEEHVGASGRGCRSESSTRGVSPHQQLRHPLPRAARRSRTQGILPGFKKIRQALHLAAIGHQQLDDSVVNSRCAVSSHHSEFGVRCYPWHRGWLRARLAKKFDRLVLRI